MQSNNDFIEVYPNALPDQLCDELVSAFDAHTGVAPGMTGHGYDPSKKQSQDLVLDNHADLKDLKQRLLKSTFQNILQYFDKYSLALMGAVSVQVQGEDGEPITITPDNYNQVGRNRLRDLVGYLYRSGTINLQKYAADVGGYPHWHSEQFPQAPGNDPLHRVVLYMYYLNDVAEGGETEFYYQNRQVKPRKGTMVVAPAAFTHSHRGKSPIGQAKYIATSWILFNRAERLYGAK